MFIAGMRVVMELELTLGREREVRGRMGASP
jgi:hypothetical protein